MVWSSVLSPPDSYLGAGKSCQYDHTIIAGYVADFHIMNTTLTIFG